MEINPSVVSSSNCHFQFISRENQISLILSILKFPLAEKLIGMIFQSCQLFKSYI